MAIVQPTSYRHKRPRVFVDSDVVFAGAASSSEYGASLTILRMAEITLIEAVASEQVLIEVERNLQIKLPATLATFRLLVERCLSIVGVPTTDDLTPHHGLADPNDLPILVAALESHCTWLVTFNVRHFRPGHPDVFVVTPGEFLQKVRYLLASL